MPLAYKERKSYYNSYEHQYRYYDQIEKLYVSFLEPVYQKVKQALNDDSLIPALEGRYVAAKDARFAGSAALRELLDSSQLHELFEFDENTQWLSNKITQGNTPNLWRYLTTILNVEEVDTEKFVRRIDINFMSSQSDDWIRSFYEFVPSSYSLRERPIIRLTDGQHVSPFKNYSEPLAYLPTEHESRFPTVKRAVCDSEKSLAFLKNLGLNEPDIVDEVIELILPKYDEEREHDSVERSEDVALIVKALSVDSLQRRAKLERILVQVPFLWATSATGTSSFCRPKDLYFRTSELESYFEANPNAWFISSEYDEYETELFELGVADGVRVNCRPQDRHGHVTIQDWHGWHERGLHGFDPDWSVDGIDFALEYPSVERSWIIWNRILIPHKHLIRGEIESCTRQTWAGSATRKEMSVAGNLLHKYAWLPNTLGEFKLPSEQTLDDLPEGFTEDNDLANALGLRHSDRPSIKSLLARDDLPDSERRGLEIVARWSQEEIEEAHEFLQRNQRTGQQEQRSNEQYSQFEHQSVSEDAYEQPKKPKRPDLEIRDIDWSASVHNTFNRESPRQYNPDVETVGEGSGSSSDEQRRHLRWDRKPENTRRFLLGEYDGRCQICDFTFTKRIGGAPYFDGIHLIPNNGSAKLNQPGNVVCLCANHAAKFLFGTVIAPDIEEQLAAEHDEGYRHINVELCGKNETIRFSECHFSELQEFRTFVEADS